MKEPLKTIVVAGGLGLTVFGLMHITAPGNIDRETAYQAAEQTQTAFSLAKTLEQAMTTQTAQAQESNNGQSGQESVDNDGLCELIPKDGTVSQTVQEANGGVFPPLEYGGKPVLVSLVHDGQITFSPLSAVLTGEAMNQANPGDRVCVDNTYTKPAPTPQSSIPSRRQMSQAGFSAAKGSQPARFQPIRRG